MLSSAFSGNDKIARISIPNADQIDISAFAGCTRLNTLTLPGLSAFDDIFGDKSLLSDLTYIAVIDKEGVNNTDIGTTFSGLSALNTLVLPSSVSGIPANAFSDTALTSLSFGSSIVLSVGSLSNMRSLEYL